MAVRGTPKLIKILFQQPSPSTSTSTTSEQTEAVIPEIAEEQILGEPEDVTKTQATQTEDCDRLFNEELYSLRQKVDTMNLTERAFEGNDKKLYFSLAFPHMWA